MIDIIEIMLTGETTSKEEEIDMITEIIDIMIGMIEEMEIEDIEEEEIDLEEEVTLLLPRHHPLGLRVPIVDQVHQLQALHLLHISLRDQRIRALSLHINHLHHLHLNLVVNLNEFNAIVF
jgi:hypothetical protein